MVKNNLIITKSTQIILEFSKSTQVIKKQGCQSDPIERIYRLSNFVSFRLPKVFIDWIIIDGLSSISIFIDYFNELE